ncbi:hypothetical protein M431DRAFT_182757 [Trichoderma harzianum CBS 226.95]|uniref:Uncharacterized protein n=1 Tax=Trichoderma harzianum CBS 226.95 TaxID=983964 RepID=A0A2T4ATS2_TRIHA|nr:hypothetical protein M431DRAFT_182757 [Trichoderma harzianum CBS 226.95]PTB60467.1 hypothetical protein M431DRAFT_182757 [Trichoderma harzianum CBS 226.95]
MNGEGRARTRRRRRDKEEEVGLVVARIMFCLSTYWMATIVSHGSIDRGGVAPMDEKENRLEPGQGKKYTHESW